MARRTRSPGNFNSNKVESYAASHEFSARACHQTLAGAGDGLVAEIPETLEDVPFLVRTTCADFQCDSKLHDRMRREFPNPEACHGAFETRVLLWGPSGQGKRQFCTHFANRLSLEHKRTILWIEAQTPITFIRDIRFAYHLMTGNPHPGDLSIVCQLERMSQALGRCNTQWFMVIFDFKPHLQSHTNQAGVDFLSFLPKGQILITYSPKMLISDRSYRVFEELPVEMASESIDIFIPSSSYAKSFCMTVLESKGVSLDQSPTSDIIRSSGIGHLLSISITAAVAKLGQISYEECLQISHHRRRKSQNKTLRPTCPAGILTNFAYMMEFLHEQLTASHRDAAYVLDILLTAPSKHVPIRILQEVLFQDHADVDLDDSLTFLESLSIIQTRQLKSGDRFVDMHLMVHSWLRSQDNCSGSNEVEELRPILKVWIRVLDQELPELQHRTHHHKYWLLLDLALSIIECTEGMRWQFPPLVSLIRKVATFLTENTMMIPSAHRLLGRALFLTLNLAERSPRFDVELERLKLHRERARLCSLMQDFADAREEMNYARSWLSAQQNSEDVQNSLTFDLDDDWIELVLREGNRQQARHLVSVALARQSYQTPAQIAKLHFWAACSAGIDHLSILDGLQHSHLAMSYWHSLEEDERWHTKWGDMIPWVDVHTHLLMQMDRGRSVLVFMPKLLDHYIKQCPPVFENIWRSAFWIMREHVAIGEVKIAERVLCRVLSLCDFAELEGQSLSWATMMLHLIGATWVGLGRYTEAETLLRICLYTVQVRKPPDLRSEGRFATSSLWLDLCCTLLLQGECKSRQVVAARKLAIENGHERLKEDDWKDYLLRPHRALIKTYDRVLIAALDRNRGTYNAEDHLLECPWPKTFSRAIQVFGDPFERIERDLLDFENDYSIARIETQTRLEIEILFLLDAPLSTSYEASRHIPDDEWRTVFAEVLPYCKGQRQRRLSEMWRLCVCSRRRYRGYARDVNSLARRLRVKRQGFDDKDDQEKTSKLFHHQSKITKYFPKRRKYPDSMCPPNCPCIKANLEGPLVTRQIEAERMYTYKMSDPAEQEAKEAAFHTHLRIHHYHFGRLPPIPYGMGFSDSWRIPEGPTEPNEDPTLVTQHESFWAPEFVHIGGQEDNWGVLGQDENYLFTNTAMKLRCQGRRNGLPDLPNIVITAYKLGEEVRGNRDRLKSGSGSSSSKNLQTNIKDYLNDVKDDSEAESERVLGTPVTNRPPRRKARLERRMKRRRRSGSRSSGAHSPLNLERSRSRSRSRSPSNERDNNVYHEGNSKSKKLELFDIQSVHSRGPIFDSRRLINSVQDRRTTRSSSSQPTQHEHEHNTENENEAMMSPNGHDMNPESPSNQEHSFHTESNTNPVSLEDTFGYQYGQPLSPIDEGDEIGALMILPITTSESEEEGGEEEEEYTRGRRR